MVGQFILREGPFKVTNKDIAAAAYWKSVVVMAPRLAKVALRVLSIAPSEASVERSFKRGHGCILCMVAWFAFFGVSMPPRL